MESKWLAVWGFGDGRECGILSAHDTRAEAEAAADAFLDRCDNPACGAWVRRDE